MEDFRRSPSEATLYVKAAESGILIVSLYVDDIIYTGSSEELVMSFKTEMMKRYEMTDLGLLHHFLGLGVIQAESYIFLHQKKYARTLLDKFGLKDCKAVSTPLAMNEKLSKEDGSEQADEKVYRQIVGSLLYLTATRPDIMFAANYGIAYEKGKEAMLVGYCDSDWSGCEDDMRSTSGYAFILDQSSVALSTAEAEYVSAAEATAQAVWLRFVLSDFGQDISRRFHFIRDALQNGEIDLLYCRTGEQNADIFTKALARDRFEYLRSKLGIISAKHLEGSVKVASQLAMECLPVVMDGTRVWNGYCIQPLLFYMPGKSWAFRSKYTRRQFVLTRSHDLHNLKDQILLTPNGI
ncbi:hypothetical protein Prudu_42S000600 [Prunus dulcis]|uniref:Reverse transcriptase Ty1/copia-type domain-containing protein n=1 Tax=Prunus dulcis TaxID=3755 RepID=A0A5H2XW76_PRUDU|nr:hypothetical protein Prudu_42S000600 [Prunus dulcis]